MTCSEIYQSGSGAIESEMYANRDRLAIITGASSGMGKETALTFAREGIHLLLADVNVEGEMNTERETRGMGV